MNNKILHCFYFIQLSICALFCSCKSSDDKTVKTNIDKTSIRQTAYISYGDNPGAEKWYEYYSNGDLKRYNSFIDTIELQYQKDSIIKIYSNNGNEWLTKIIYQLDYKNRVVTSTIWVEKNEKLSSYIFEYTKEGYLSKTVQTVFATGYSYVQEFKYIDGNLSEIQTYTYDGKPASRYIYSYYPDQPNILNLFFESILDDYFTNERLGKMNKNLVKEMVNLSIEGDTLSWLKYKYYTDPGNKFLKQHETDVLNNNSTERIFHF